MLFRIIHSEQFFNVMIYISLYNFIPLHFDKLYQYLNIKMDSFDMELFKNNVLIGALFPLHILRKLWEDLEIRNTSVS